jgi:hypothetical protein
MTKVQLNVWVEETEREALKRLAADRGVSLGQLIRDEVFGSSAQPNEHLEDLERRVSRLEEMAGL